MSNSHSIATKQTDNNGAVAVLVAVTLIVLLGFTALAVDVGYLYGVRNELQNGADAGALAGAAVLFDEGNIDLINTAGVVAEANKLAGANSADGENISEIIVEWGHWSFTNKEFTSNENATQLEGWQEMNFATLDLDINFINAVRVTTSKADTTSFFAKILGYQEFFVRTDAVAYRGFAGTLDKFDIDQPLAICEDSLRNIDGEYSCSVGRMINSGPNLATNETGGWTNFDQNEETCQSGTNANEVGELICGAGNPEEIELGKGVGAIGGQTNALGDLFNCWLEHAADNDDNGIPDEPWNITLLVVQCDNNNMENCPKVVGAVNLNVIWINNYPGDEKKYEKAPRKMNNVPGHSPWVCAESGEEECWASFVEEYQIKNADGNLAPYQGRAIYFLPDCTLHEPMGVTGGENFGILAKYPKLVE
ncbi:MAG: pilus assembly protein TadG-related protein [Desulfobulbaceae bacterium]|nr:pilus assembly protein TadG-related protein [Desulfobulbaceae bacterium]